MLIKIIRHWFTEKSTIGLMDIDGKTMCFTLEDVARPDGVKVQGQTSIPCGEYPIIVNHSNRFNRLMPLVQNVPMFSGIRIHPGNTTENTEGCILVGIEKGDNVIWRSQEAFNLVFDLINNAYTKNEPICLEIINKQLNGGI